MFNLLRNIETFLKTLYFSCRRFLFGVNRISLHEIEQDFGDTARDDVEREILARAVKAGQQIRPHTTIDIESVYNAIENGLTGDSVTAPEIELAVYRSTGYQINQSTLRTYLHRLKKSGRIRSPMRGRYIAVANEQKI